MVEQNQVLDKNTDSNKTDDYPPYMKPRQAAEYIGLSYDWLLHLTRKGDIPAKKINSIYRYRKVDLDVYMIPDGI